LKRINEEWREYDRVRGSTKFSDACKSSKLSFGAVKLKDEWGMLQRFILELIQQNRGKEDSVPRNLRSRSVAFSVYKVQLRVEHEWQLARRAPPSGCTEHA
jgi:hypothetical protein